jgi:hypothetical protein
MYQVVVHLIVRSRHHNHLKEKDLIAEYTPTIIQFQRCAKHANSRAILSLKRLPHRVAVFNSGGGVLFPDADFLYRLILKITD